MVALRADKTVIGTADMEGAQVWRYELRWRVDGQQRRRRFKADADGRAAARVLQRRLEYAADLHHPADGDGLPLEAAPVLTRMERRAVAAADDPPSFTIAELVAYALEHNVAKMTSKSTRNHHRTNLRHLERFAVYPPNDPRGAAGLSMVANDLTTDDANRILACRVAYNGRRKHDVGKPGSRQVSGKSERDFLDVARRLMRTARTMKPPQLVGNDPFEAVTTRGQNAKDDVTEDGARLAIAEARRHAITVREMLSVAEFLPAFYRIHVLVMMCMPMRVGELRVMPLNWIDTKSWTLTINADGSMKVKDRPLGVTRPIPIPDWEELRTRLLSHLEAAEALHEIRTAKLRREVATAKPGLAKTLNDRLALHESRVLAFPTHTGAMLDGHNFNPRYWYPALAAAAAADASLERFVGMPFRELRHAAHNDLLVNAGLSPRAVAEIAGNSESTIARYYARTTTDRAEQIRRGVDGRWQNIGSDGNPTVGRA